jgi:hypothetical protein
MSRGKLAEYAGNVQRASVTIVYRAEGARVISSVFGRTKTVNQSPLPASGTA